jgi:hypothetical protein
MQDAIQHVSIEPRSDAQDSSGRGSSALRWPLRLNAVTVNLANVDERELAALLKLRESIDRLKAQQLATEKLAGLNGMTADESKQYKMRHRLIMRLTEQLLDLENGDI